MISDVPKMAIDYIDLYDNTSVLFDEMLSLRLGLVPAEDERRHVPLPAGMRLQWRRLRPMPGVADPVGRRAVRRPLPGSQVLGPGNGARGPERTHRRAEERPEGRPDGRGSPGHGKGACQVPAGVRVGLQEPARDLHLREMRPLQGMHRRVPAGRVQGREGQACRRRNLQVLDVQTVHRGL